MTITVASSGSMQEFWLIEMNRECYTVPTTLDCTRTGSQIGSVSASASGSSASNWSVAMAAVSRSRVTSRM